MALTLPYTALLTPAELRRDALASLSLDVGETGGAPDEVEDYEAAVSAIIDATSLVEEAAGMPIIARAYTERFRVLSWHRIQYDTLRWAAFPRAFPAFEVTTAGYEVDDERPGRRRIMTDLDPAEVTVSYFAGYRRRDQDLAALQAATDPDDDISTPLSGVTVLPPLLPGYLRQAALELTLHRLYQAESKQYGTGRRQQQIGSAGLATVEAVDTDFERRILSGVAARHRPKVWAN